TQQLGVLDLPDYAERPGGGGAPEHLVAAGRAVGVQRARIDLADPAQQPQRSAVGIGLRHKRGWQAATVQGGDRRRAELGCHNGGQDAPPREGACLLDHRGQAPVALAKAWAALPRQTRAVGTGTGTVAAAPLGPEAALQLVAEPVRAVDLAGQVVTD